MFFKIILACFFPNKNIFLLFKMYINATKILQVNISNICVRPRNPCKIIKKKYKV